MQSTDHIRETRSHMLDSRPTSNAIHTTSTTKYTSSNTQIFKISHWHNYNIAATNLKAFRISKMSTFGAPGTGVKIGRPNPPAKGSFPLDHDAECQPLMKQYLRCLKTARGVNSPECRELSKNYLSCRMERGLMAPDEMKNLGYAEGQTATDDVGKGIKK
jgi:cytochrome c oxidase assembly protein subunit 19